MLIEQQKRAERVRFRHPIRVVTLEGEPRVIRTLTANVSRRGLFVRMPEPLPSGTKIALSLEAGGRALALAQAEVMWGRRAAGCGVRFTEFLHPRAKELVEYLVENLDQGKPLTLEKKRPLWKRAPAVVAMVMMFVVIAALPVVWRAFGEDGASPEAAAAPTPEVAPAPSLSPAGERFGERAAPVAAPRAELTEQEVAELEKELAEASAHAKLIAEADEELTEADFAPAVEDDEPAVEAAAVDEAGPVAAAPVAEAPDSEPAVAQPSVAQPSLAQSAVAQPAVADGPAAPGPGAEPVAAKVAVAAAPTPVVAVPLAKSAVVAPVVAAAPVAAPRVDRPLPDPLPRGGEGERGGHVKLPTGASPRLAWRVSGTELRLSPELSSDAHVTRAFVLTGPPRAVFDLSGAAPNKSLTVNASAPFATGVRLGKQGTGTRIVVDLAQAPKRTQQDDGALVLSF